MDSASKLYRFANLLSIDVAAGAVCGALFFGRLLHAELSLASCMALGLTVWIIYTVDHLSDALKIDSQDSTPRHRFHKIHFRRLCFSLAVVCILNLVLIIFLDERTRLAGVGLFTVVSIYYFWFRHNAFLKEFFIALIYTAGILLPAAAITAMPLSNLPWISILLFFLTALINVLMFSWFDHDKDQAQGFASLSTRVGKRATLKIIIVLFFLVLVVSLAVEQWRTLLVILPMNLIMVLLLVNYRYVSIHERFRLIGEGVFFMPVVLLWY